MYVKNHVAARYAGTEFVVLMPVADTDAALRLAGRVRAAIAATPVELPGGESVTMTISNGIAAAGPGRPDVDLKTDGDALRARADVALYRVRSAGRNRIEVDTGR